MPPKTMPIKEYKNFVQPYSFLEIIVKITLMGH